LKHDFSRPGLLLALAGGFVGLACQGPAGAPSTTASPAATQTASASPQAASPSPDPKKLVGQWMRTDSQYMIWIEAVGSDGTLQARYLNPRPINVSRAEVKRNGDRLSLLVELQDKGYPGSYYTLTYDPRSDALYGVYHHLGLNQTFDISFYRFKEEHDEGRQGPSGNN
jgi:hypothetical protein